MAPQKYPLPKPELIKLLKEIWEGDCVKGVCLMNYRYKIQATRKKYKSKNYGIDVLITGGKLNHEQRKMIDDGKVKTYPFFYFK